MGLCTPMWRAAPHPHPQAEASSPGGPDSLTAPARIRGSMEDGVVHSDVAGRASSASSGQGLFSRRCATAMAEDARGDVRTGRAGAAESAATGGARRQELAGRGWRHPRQRAPELPRRGRRPWRRVRVCSKPGGRQKEVAKGVAAVGVVPGGAVERRQAARGHGAVTSMAAGSDDIVLGTSPGWLVRHDFSFEDAQGESPPYSFSPLLSSLQSRFFLVNYHHVSPRSRPRARPLWQARGAPGVPGPRGQALRRHGDPPRGALRPTTTTPGGHAPSRSPASVASSSMPSPGIVNPSPKHQPRI